MKGDIIVRFFV